MQAVLPTTPSIARYGTLVLQRGFTQHPRSVADYLNTLSLCPREKDLVLVLESYRWEAEQEVFPSAKTLAQRCQCSQRRIRQMTAHLEELGILRRLARFGERSQLSNAYDLEPLYQRVAAWLDPEVDAALSEQESRAFVPEDALEEVAQVLCEEFGEATPEASAIRLCTRRLRQRWFLMNDDWEAFTLLVEQAAAATEQRAGNKTQSGQTFAPLLAYFFSALDYGLSKRGPTLSRQPESRVEVEQTQQKADFPQQEARANSTEVTRQVAQAPERSERLSSKQAEMAHAPEKSGLSSRVEAAYSPEKPASTPGQDQAERSTRHAENARQVESAAAPEEEAAAAWYEAGLDLLQARRMGRRAAEHAGRPKVRASKLLALHIDTIARSFHDAQIHSSIQRAANLMADARLEEEVFLELAQSAREEAYKHQVTKKNGSAPNRMPYFFSVLEDKVRQALAC